MKKLKLYLDTSVINFAVSDDPARKEEKEQTVGLIERINSGEIEGYISTLVEAEIQKADDAKRKILIDFIKRINLSGVIEITDDVRILARKYVAEGIIPEKHYNDAEHIAAAVIFEMDVIVSWNFEHMVKLKTKRGIVGVNSIVGYRAIEIITPEEV